MSASHLWLPLILISTASALAAPKEPAPKSTGTYELKKRSSFTLAEAERPPLWPIGWVKKQAAPAQAVAVVVAPQIVLDPKSFLLTSILLGSPPLAVINGRSYTEGEYLKARGTAPRVQLVRIGDGTAQVRAVDGQILEIVLRRPELGTKKVDDGILNEDR